MSKSLHLPAIGLVVGIVLLVAPNLLANDRIESRPPMTGKQGRGEMMQNCGAMMQNMIRTPGTGKPNDQWRKDAPVPPKKSE